MRILDSEFRKELFKNLVEAGYSKTEAQTIVGKKYFDSLKNDVMSTISSIGDKVNNNDFTVEVNGQELNDKIKELDKLFGILSPKKEEEKK